MLIDRIESYLNGVGKDIDQALLDEVGSLSLRAFKRQFGVRPASSPTLRLSSIGRCPRQQSYTILGFSQNGKEIDARAKMVFFQGDLVELAIIGLLKVVGCDVSSAQETIHFEGVEGHPDGIYNDLSGRYLLEVKSMSSYSFSDFQKGVIDDGYRWQINSYLKALGLNKCVMIGLNKDAGVLHEIIIEKDEQIIKRIKETIQVIKKATKENLPPRPYGPDAKGFYPWQCLYCQFRGECLPNASLVLEKNKYRLKNV